MTPSPNPHRVLLLGLGAQGRAALHDLVTGDDTTRIVAADNDSQIERYVARYPAARVAARRIDANDHAAVSGLMRDADVVIEALPGPFAPRMARLAASNGVSLVSSMYFRDPQERNPRAVVEAERGIQELDHLARQNDLILLTEFGLDPGLDLVLGAAALRGLDTVLEFHAYGAGIPGPSARSNPLHYKFSWSPIGVIRSYQRPARIITRGESVDIDPRTLFEARRVHRLDLPAIGASLECYPNGDAVYYAELFGIRGSVREMARYTGRLPGHCAFWDLMVKSGFLDPAPIVVDGSSVSPAAFVASLLSGQSQFQYGESEPDMTFVRIDVRGIRAGTTVRVVYDLVDTRDLATGFTSMQRTVGFTLALGARLILDGALEKRGLLTPLDVPYELVFPALERHGIRVARQETPL